jgi:methionine--tRNA ligase beta chain
MTNTSSEKKIKPSDYKRVAELAFGGIPTDWDWAIGTEVYKKTEVNLKNNMKPEIDFNEFLEISNKLEVTLGRITEVERVPKSDKLLKLQVSLGENEPVTVVTNIGDKVSIPNYLVGRQFYFVTNLKPAKIMGIESKAMILVPLNKNSDIDFSLELLPGTKLI